VNSRNLAVLGVVATIGLAGCGGDSDEGASEPAASTPPPVTTTEAAETETTADTASEPATSGKATPGGTSLSIGEPATIAYEDSGNPKRKSLIEVTPKTIEKGAIDDFANIDLDPEQKASTPYYATVAVKNIGDGDLSGTDPGSYIDAVDDRGQRQNEIIFFGDFDRCPGDDPKQLGPGDSYETCLTYLVPGGGSIEGMEWVFFDEKNSKSDINWK